jgi:alpha-tubulin suppressor-like RCC1 family protein
MSQQGDLPKVKAIAAGAAHAVALMADGKLLAWGWNEHGEIGDGTNTDRPAAVPVRHGPAAVGPERVKAIAAGGALQQSKWGFDGGHSLALLASGEVIGWGFNAEGEAGSAPEYFGAVLAGPPVKSSGGGEEWSPLPRVAAISAGGLHSLAIGPQS